MFVVFNKSKINSYLLSILTVSLLFAMPFFIKNDNIQQTSTNITNELQKNELNEIN